jgi:putative endonuclease
VVERFAALLIALLESARSEHADRVARPLARDTALMIVSGLRGRVPSQRHPSVQRDVSARAQPQGDASRKPTAGRGIHARTAGRLGEELAAAHLQRLGFRVLARNARTRRGEIDVIAFDGRTLVFVEVKTRRVRAAGGSISPPQEPLSGLTARQQTRLRALAAAWLSDHRRERPSARTIRFDAVGVLVDHTGALRRLEHLEGAW